MELKIASDNDQQIWDSVVERSSNSSLFHTWKWLRLVEKYTNFDNEQKRSSCTFYPVLLMEKGCPVGLFPLFIVKKFGFNFCYSPPTNMEMLYLGPLFPDIHAMKQEKKQIFLIDVQKTVDRFIKKNLRSKYIQINTPPGFDDCRPYKWGGYAAVPRYTYHIDLGEDCGMHWKNFNRSLRYYIEKARKEGITVSDGDKEDEFHIYTLLKNNDRIKAPKEFIDELYDLFYPDHLKVFIAKIGPERLSGILTLMHKDKVQFWVGSPRCSYKGLSPNELVLWESIRWAGEHGYKIFEIMGADDYSLFPFKRKFNGKLIPYYQMKWFSPVFYLLSSAYNTVMRTDKNILDLSDE